MQGFYIICHPSRVYYTVLHQVLEKKKNVIWGWLKSKVAMCWVMQNCRQCSTLSSVCASSIRVSGGFSFNEPVAADITGSCSTSRSVIPTISWSSGIWISLRICSASFEPASKGSFPWHKTFKTSYPTVKNVHVEVNLLRRLHTIIFCHTKCYSFYNGHCPL